MRSERMATCTSAEPVSCGERAWVLIRSAFRSTVIDIGISGSEVEHANGTKLSGAQLANGRRPVVSPRQNGAGRKPFSIRSGEPRLQRFDLSGEQNDRSPLREPKRLLVGHGQRRDVVQRGLDRGERV